MNLLNNAIIKVPVPGNEPVYSYAPGTPERAKLKAALKELAAKKIEIPLIIGGKEIRTGKIGQVVMPHKHKHVLAEYHMAGEAEIKLAIKAAMAAKVEWEALRWEERAAIFLKAAELLSGKYRYQMNATSMLSTGKTAYQAEIDATCELIDFLRFNVYYAQQIYSDLPQRNLEFCSAAAAGGLCAGDCAVQLYRHCRQPADGPGDHGQHYPAETRIQLHLHPLPADADPQGSRLARRSHQLHPRFGESDRQNLPAEQRSRRRPLHRFNRRLPEHVADDRPKYRRL
jgi:hypothetical protein